MKETAKAYYLGKKGPHRLNCAQAIAVTLQEKYPLGDETMAQLSSCGGGRAPECYCGAFYAAKCILDRYASEKTAEKMELLQSFAGSLKCREIKALRKKSCLECIEKAVEAVAGQHS